MNWFISTKAGGNSTCKSWTPSLKVVVSGWQVWTTGRSRLLGDSRLLANTGWPLIKDLCLFSSAFTLGSTCCWGGCSTSYWIANLFLGGLPQPGRQMRVEEAIRHPCGAEDGKLEWGEGTTEMVWGGAGAMRNVHRWKSGFATPASWFPSLRPWNYCFHLKGGGAKCNLTFTSDVCCSLNQDDLQAFKCRCSDGREQ